MASVAPISPTQAQWRGRIEGGLRVAAPVLDLVLAFGERLSNTFAPDDRTQDLEPGDAGGKHTRTALSDGSR